MEFIYGIALLLLSVHIVAYFVYVIKKTRAGTKLLQTKLQHLEQKIIKEEENKL